MENFLISMEEKGFSLIIMGIYTVGVICGGFAPNIEPNEE